MEVNRESCDNVVTDMGSSFLPIRDTVNSAEKNRGNSESMDENSTSNDSKEVQLDQEHALRILQKMSNLSIKIHKEQMVLSEKVKGITHDPFPDLEVFNTLRLLSAEYDLLKKKYIEESSERKRLYNEVIELKGNIRVFCRCRPLNETEITNGSVSVVQIDLSEDDELKVLCSDSSKKIFKFDSIFRLDDMQDTVFAQTKTIVTSVMNGYNVCIFAYGQTGTGKTFTMEGTPESRGVNRILGELFRITWERSSVMRYKLFVSMLEVYNERIKDLLVDSSNQPPKK